MCWCLVMAYFRKSFDNCISQSSIIIHMRDYGLISRLIVYYPKLYRLKFAAMSIFMKKKEIFLQSHWNLFLFERKIAPC
jgi:hypothetical protein